MMLRRLVKLSESDKIRNKKKDGERKAGGGTEAKHPAEPPGTPVTRNTPSTQGSKQQQGQEQASEGPTPKHGGSDDISSVHASSTLGGDDTNTLASLRQSHRWRRKTLKLLESAASTDAEQARRAGHLAAEYYWRLALQQQESSSRRDELWHASCLGDAASVESHDHDDESIFSRVSKKATKSVGEKSSERAARRGMRRGKREDNEKKSGGRPGDGSTMAETALSGGSKSPYSNSKRRPKRRGFFERREKRAFVGAFYGSDGEDDSNLEADAWMCGVCGKAFTTLEAADKHEQDHIQQVVDSLPWMARQAEEATVGPLRTTTLATGLLSQEAKEEEKKEIEDPRDDPFHSTFNTSSLSRGQSHSRNSQSTLGSQMGLGKINEGDRENGELQLRSFPQSASNEKEPPEPFRNTGSFSQGQIQSRNSQSTRGKEMGVGKINEGDRETCELGFDSFRQSASNEKEPPERLSSDLIEEVLEEERSQQQQLSLSYNHGKTFAEDEKSEIEQEEGPETALVSYRDRQIQTNRPLTTQQLYDALAPYQRVQQQSPYGLTPYYQNQQTPMMPYQSNNTMRTPSTPENWPGNEFMLEPGALVPRLRSEARFHQEYLVVEEESSVPRRIDPLLGEATEPHEALLSNTVRDYVILADEALVTVCEKARKLILSPEEIHAERRLSYLARDKAYYDELTRRSAYRKHLTQNNRKDAGGVVGKVQNKFLDAYQLMKEGTDKKGFRDEYNARTKKNAGVQDQKLVVHNQKTLYLNVMVQNGIEVVKNELERLAHERWESSDDVEKFTRFERFRVFAHMNIVRLAGLALSSDFTPRRIAVQLSNDIYRLLTPRLKRRGVTIETEIEYRVGPYFVLAVNVLRIDWRRLIKATHRDVQMRNERWQQAQDKEQEENNNNSTSGGDEGEQASQPQKEPSTFMKWKDYIMHVLSLTRYDILAVVLHFLYEHTHWIIHQPLCIFFYHTFFGSLVRQFILSSVTNEIFYYVEEKGMEMNIEIRTASMQAAFMLSALREIRADSKQKKQKDAPTEVGVLGPLLGPAIPADGAAASKPADFEVPADLEYVGLELDVPVGFRRLRWALLSTESKFMTEALYRVEANYENISMGEWNHHNEYIGTTKKLPDDVKEEDFIGSEKVGSYLMPKSAFVKANVCTETHYIQAYNDYCFTLKKKALTPDVPFGSTFVAWTQFTVINTGNDSCRLQFSVEPEFPNGPPMVSGQIKSGMRAGVGELFVLIGETIAKYADEYP